MRPRPRLVGAAALTALTAALAAGCTTSAEPEPAAAFTPPTWFAQQAQEREERRTLLQACIARSGWNVTMDEFGGAAEPFTDEAEVARFGADRDACLVELGLPAGPPELTVDDLHEFYRGNVDTLACLRDQGFPLEDPPSEDAWVEQALSAFSGSATGAPGDDVAAAQLWHPYDAVPELQQADPDLEQDRGTLERTCPQWFAQ